MAEFMLAALSKQTSRQTEQARNSNGALLDQNHQNTNVPAPAQSFDYYPILLEAIQKAHHDSAQLRSLVYERIRFNLKRDILYGHSSFGLADLVQQIKSFEHAVARIEANATDFSFASNYRETAKPFNTDDSSADATTHILSTTTAPAPNRTLSPQTLPPIAATAPYTGFASTEHGTEFNKPRAARHYLRAALLLFGISLVAIVFTGTVIIGGALWHLSDTSTQTNKAQQSVATNDKAANEPRVEKTSSLPFPLPNSFGVYALNDNKLAKLEALPIRIPDPRVALSAQITRPSAITLPNNKPAFIVFRRDLLNNAPERLTLRVVARVMRNTRFVNGKATVIKGDDAWRVRNIALDFKVAPVPNQPEMIIAQADEDLTLAPGRYALVLGGVGYDFTIEGPIKSLAQCLEEFEASNGSVLSECRTL